MVQASPLSVVSTTTKIDASALVAVCGVIALLVAFVLDCLVDFSGTRNNMEKKNVVTAQLVEASLLRE